MFTNGVVEKTGAVVVGLFIKGLLLTTGAINVDPVVGVVFDITGDVVFINGFGALDLFVMNGLLAKLGLGIYVPLLATAVVVN